MPLHALARAGLAVTLLLGLVGTAHALTLKSEEFKTHRRPAVTFDHDNHNERAKIEDCIVCHHGGENGVIDPEVSSEDQPCSECHKANMPSGRTPLATSRTGSWTPSGCILTGRFRPKPHSRGFSG